MIGSPLAAPPPPRREACPDRLHDLLEGQAALEVLLGGVAHLGVHHPVLGQVLDALCATRRRFSADCITATVWSKVSR